MAIDLQGKDSIMQHMYVTLVVATEGTALLAFAAKPSPGTNLFPMGNNIWKSAAQL